MANYVLTLSDDQANIVKDACELYARLGLGQFNRITEMFLDRAPLVEDYTKRRDEANSLLKQAAVAIYGEDDRGFVAPPRSVDRERAWNVYQVIRHAQAWHEHPEGGRTVNFDEPFSLIDELLPKCRIENDDP